MLKTGKKKEKDPCENGTVATGKVSVVAQELKFAKMLASNDVKVRNGVLKSLKKWLNTRSQSSYRKYLLLNFPIVTSTAGLVTNGEMQLVENPKEFCRRFSHTQLHRNDLNGALT